MTCEITRCAKAIRLPPRAQVIAWVKRAIDDGVLRSGDPLPSERALSEQLGVSRVTVHAALQELSRIGLVEKPRSTRVRRVAVRRDGPSASDLGLMSNTVAILGAADPTRPEEGTDSSVSYHAARVIERAGHHVLAICPGASDVLQGASLAVLRPLGVIAGYDIGECETGRSLIAECVEAGIPVVVYGDARELARYDRVDSDQEQGAYELTRFLIGRGCRRILRFWRFPENPHWVTQRDRGCERALREAGLEIIPPLRTPDLTPREPTTKEEFDHLVRIQAGYLSESVCGAASIDGLLAVSDRHAFQAAAALRLLGREPNRHVLLGGYDNTFRHCVEREWESVGPVVTVNKHNERIGQELAKLLKQRLEGRLPGEPQLRVLPEELVVLAPAAAQKDRS